MNGEELVESLIEQAADLPFEGQTALLESLIGMRSQHLGFYDPDEV